MSDAVMLYVTCGSMEEAKSIAAHMVKERLAACANILPGMVSVYQWQGQIEESQEVVLLLKTQDTLSSKAMAVIKDMHSYDTPAILKIDIAAGDPDYLSWLVAETIRT